MQQRICSVVLIAQDVDLIIDFNCDTASKDR